MTYIDLLILLNALSVEQLKDTVTVFDPIANEAFPVKKADYPDEDFQDVLSPTNLMLII
jgi:hypothetical protein